MGVSRRLFVAVAAGVLMISPLAASSQTGTGSVGLPTVREAIDGLLERGIDRADIVVQRGHRNYAGPACPGEGWACTTSPIVVQHAPTGEANVAECSPAGSIGDGTCAIVQVSAGGANDARCEITETGNEALLSCSIEQVNTTGPNDAEAVQSVTQDTENATVNQVVDATASIEQQNGSGANTSAVTQSASQTLTVGLPLASSHGQNTSMCASVHQTSTTGPNDSDITQTHAASSSVFNVIQANQRQQDEPVVEQPCEDGGLSDQADLPNLHIVATQFSDTGAIDQAIQQHQSLSQEATSVLGAVDQQQGPEAAFTGGGLAVEIDGDTTSTHSQYTADVIKEWSQDALSLGSIAQVQNDREILSGIGLNQGSRSYKDCIWTLGTTLDATGEPLADPPTQTSSQKALAHCTRSMDGTITSNLNGSEETATFDDEFVNEDVHRGPGAPEGGSGSFPHLHKAVVNDSAGQGFGTMNEVPNTTSALPGNQITYRLRVHNHGAAGTMLTGIEITDVIPPHMTFDDEESSYSCSASGSGGPGDTVTCTIPPMAAGEIHSRYATFDLDADPSAYDFPEVLANRATLSTDEHPDVPSNVARVRVVDAHGELHKAVVNESAGEGFEGPDAPASTSAVPGDFIRYRLTAHNHGTEGTLTDVTLTEVVPDHMTAFSCTSPCSITGSGGPGETVYWSAPNIPPGGSASVDVVFRLDGIDGFDGGFPAEIENTAFMWVGGLGPFESPATTVVVEPAAGPSFAKAVRSCSECPWMTVLDASGGDTVTYRLTYTNLDGVGVHDVVLHDALPAHMTFVSCSPSCATTPGGSPPIPGAGPGTHLYFDVGDVAGGASAVVTFRATIDADSDPGWLCPPEGPPGVREIDNVADGWSASQAPFGSNTATVRVDPCFVEP